MVSPKPLVSQTAGASTAYAAKPVSIDGPLVDAEPAAFTAVDATPADATAVATDLIAIRSALIAAGLMEAS